MEELLDVREAVEHWSQLDLLHNCFDPDEMSRWRDFPNVPGWFHTRHAHNHDLRSFFNNRKDGPIMPGTILEMLEIRNILTTGISPLTIPGIQDACLAIVERDRDPLMEDFASILTGGVPHDGANEGEEGSSVDVTAAVAPGDRSGGAGSSNDPL